MGLPAAARVRLANTGVRWPGGAAMVTGVTSNLACIGLRVADDEAMRQLIHAAMEGAESIARRGSLTLYRWQDPSGARLLVWTEGGTVVDLLPSYAAEPGARLARVHMVNEDVAVADVVDQDGQTCTMLAAELEQRRFLPGDAVEGRASIVALGVDVSVHASESAFAASDASLLSDGETTEPPAYVVEKGWPWPPRMAAESFISHGVFDEGAEARAYARLNCVVLAAGVRTSTMTGQRFVAARVRCLGFEAEVCFPAEVGTPIPVPGSIVAGTVFLVASMPDVALPMQVRAHRLRLPRKR